MDSNVINILLFSKLCMSANKDNILIYDNFKIGRYANLLDIDVIDLKHSLNYLEKERFIFRYRLFDSNRMMINPNVYNKCSTKELSKLVSQFNSLTL